MSLKEMGLLKGNGQFTFCIQQTCQTLKVLQNTIFCCLLKPNRQSKREAVLEPYCFRLSVFHIWDYYCIIKILIHALELITNPNF